MIATAKNSAHIGCRMSPAFRAALLSPVEITADAGPFAAIETGPHGQQVIVAGPHCEMLDLAALVRCQTGRQIEVVPIASAKVAS